MKNLGELTDEEVDELMERSFGYDVYDDDQINYEEFVKMIMSNWTEG